MVPGQPMVFGQPMVPGQQMVLDQTMVPGQQMVLDQTMVSDQLVGFARRKGIGLLFLCPVQPSTGIHYSGYSP